MHITRIPRIHLLYASVIVILFLSITYLNAQSLAIQSQMLGSTAQKVEGDQLNDPDEFEAWVEAFLAQHTSDPQLPIALVVVKDGMVFFQKGYGQVSEQRSTPVTANQTIFRAASISKLVTATAVLQLVERGRLDLDANINLYLTRFQMEDNYPSPITTRHLLTHTSGIEDRLFGNTVPSADQLVSLADYFGTHVPRRIRPPGEQIAYSNTGMALAGYLVEAVSSLPFEEYVEHNIFQPLGMTRSSFQQPYPSKLAHDVVPSGADGGAMLLYPSGSMVSTVADMGRFLAAHLNDGRVGDTQILSEENIHEMQKQQFTAHTNIPGMAFGFFENYTNGRRVLYHTGLSGHQSLFFLLPEENVGFYLVLSARQDGPDQNLRKEFMQAFLDRYYPAPQPFILPAPPADFAKRAEHFTGIFRPNLLPQTTVEKLGNLGTDTQVTENGDGTLTVALPPLGSMKFRIVEVEPLLFRSEDGFYFAFGEDQDGNIRSMNMSGSIVDPASFERLEWYESGTLHALLAAFGFLILSSFPVIEVARFILYSRRKQTGHKSSTSRMRRMAWAIPTLVTVLVTLSPILAFAWYFIGDPELRPYKIESALYISLSVLQLAALLGLTLPYFAVRAWKSGEGSVVLRVYFSMVALVGALMLPFLWYWNLLGFRF